MRTNIEIDDALLQQAIKATGAMTKKGAIEAAMQLTVQLKAQEGLRKLRGIGWDGDLRAMRESRFLDKDGFFRQDSGTNHPDDLQPRRKKSTPADKASAR